MQTHRHTVRDAILDATAALASRQGLASVTMSGVATEAGIGRATLYKYFSDVEAILTTWHERQVNDHLRQLAEARDRAGDAAGRLEAVLTAFAMISHDNHDGTELATLLHRGEHVARAQHELQALVRDLVAAGAAAGTLRDDVAPDELAKFCLHALTAASGLPSADSVHRLVNVTLAGLRRPRG